MSKLRFRDSVQFIVSADWILKNPRPPRWAHVTFTTEESDAWEELLSEPQNVCRSVINRADRRAPNLAVFASTVDSLLIPQAAGRPSTANSLRCYKLWLGAGSGGDSGAAWRRRVRWERLKWSPGFVGVVYRAAAKSLESCFTSVGPEFYPPARSESCNVKYHTTVLEVKWSFIVKTR